MESSLDSQSRKEMYDEGVRLIEEATKNPQIGHNTNKVIEVKKGWGLSRAERNKLYKDAKITHIVTMFYDNQSVKHFVVKGVSPYFMDGKNGYLLYNPAKFYDITQNQSHLFYAEGFIMPIDSIKIIGGKDVSFAIHPSNFREIWESQELKIVLTAKSLKKWLFYLILITGITLFITFILMLIIGGPAIYNAIASASGGGGGAVPVSPGG
ncbi:MAG: hypothetical protein NTY03_04320 [Candidatus Bathyarchaeota archaeon]|nr:hypothetical protein [Candidatus Bathyarchaeota archaeon]